MKTYEATEQAYKNGYEKGYADATDNNVGHKWIPFNEIKPKDGQSVLAVTELGEMEVFQFDANWPYCLCQCGGNIKTYYITHWMPLPAPPKGE